MRIFLSHSSRDKALVREIAEQFPSWLQQWIDEDRLLVGSELAPTLKEAIDSEADFVVLLFGKEAADSAWVKREVAWARAREEDLGRTFLLPVLLGDFRDRLADLGLEDRLTLELPDFGRGSTRLLAERLVDHISHWMSRELAAVPVRPGRTRNADALRDLTEKVVGIVDEMPDRYRSDVEAVLMRPFVENLAESRSGKIPLTSIEYYRHILSHMAGIGAGAQAIAVSTLSSDLWSQDADQTRYAALNIEAVKRGTHIQRLFVLAEGRAGSYADEIMRQQEAGIEARVASMTLLAEVPDLQDFVLFETRNGSRAYVSQPSIDGSRRIRGGSLVVSEYALERMRSVFGAAWELAATPAAFFSDHTTSRSEQIGRPAPGTSFYVHRLRAPVITCEEAARARGIPLAHELKTLLLQTQHGMVAAHLPGDGVLSLRKVKTRLESAEAYLADPEDLLELGLSAGTVSAVLDPVWSMPHLVTRRLLELDRVLTNNGTRMGYFEFNPAVLTEALDVIVDDFEKP